MKLIRAILIILALGAPIRAGFVYMNEAIDVDNCLDQGGSYDYKNMTIICTWAWDAFLNGKVYYCTDGGALDYLFVENSWVHARSGSPIVVVPKIFPPNDMGDPDSIKQGWSVAGLWGMWVLFFSTSRQAVQRVL